MSSVYSMKSQWHKTILDIPESIMSVGLVIDEESVIDIDRLIVEFSVDPQRRDGESLETYLARWKQLLGHHRFYMSRVLSLDQLDTILEAISRVEDVMVRDCVTTYFYLYCVIPVNPSVENWIVCLEACRTYDYAFYEDLVGFSSLERDVSGAVCGTVPCWDEIMNCSSNKLKTMYKRVSTPHLELEESLNVYYSMGNYEKLMDLSAQGVARARKCMDAIDSVEIAVENDPQNDQLWIKYLNLVTRDLRCRGYPNLAQCLLFRCLNCVTDPMPLWKKVVKYSKDQILIHTMLKYNPLSCEAFMLYLRYCELVSDVELCQKVDLLLASAVDQQHIKDVVLETLNALVDPFSVVSYLQQWFSWAITLDDVFHAVEKRIIELLRTGDVSQLLNQFVQAFSTSAEVWLYCITVDNSFIKQAMSASLTMDWPERIHAEYLLLSRGQDYYTAQQEVASALTQLAKIRAQQHAEVEAVMEQVVEQPVETSVRKREHEDDSNSNKQRKVDRDATLVAVLCHPDTSEQQIRQVFHDCEGIESITVRPGFVVIELQTHQQQLAALTKSHKQINDMEIKVTKPVTLWATNYAPNETEESLVAMFEQFGGHVVSVRLPSLKFNANRRFCYVAMASEEEAATCIERLNGTSVNEYKLIVKKSDPEAQKAKRFEVYVHNLPFKTNVKQLNALFGQFGEILKVNLRKGHAFVSFKEEESMNLAVSLNMTNFHGRVIEVSKADSKGFQERQQVKKLLAQKPDNVVAIYPVDANKAQISELVGDGQVLLVTDHRAALVVCESVGKAGQLMMKLNGSQFMDGVVNCASIRDMLSFK